MEFEPNTVNSLTASDTHEVTAKFSFKSSIADVGGLALGLFVSSFFLYYFFYLYYIDFLCTRYILKRTTCNSRVKQLLFTSHMTNRKTKHWFSRNSTTVWDDGTIKAQC